MSESQVPTPVVEQGGDAPAAATSPGTGVPFDRQAAGGAPHDARPKRHRRRRKPGAGEMSHAHQPARAAEAEHEPAASPADLIGGALDRLAKAYLDLRRRTGGGRLHESGEAEEVELTLRVPLKRAAVGEAAERLVQSLRLALEKRVLAAGMLVPGRAWCFSSESFDSDYSRPSDPRQVLVGYGLEGRPRYADLVTLAIERKHESVEQLLAGKEGAVSFVEPGSTITEGVRPAFDPAVIPYRLVGQAICGLFASKEEGRRVALTIQVLAHDGEDGKAHLILHPVSAIDLWDLPDQGVRRILSGCQSQLTQLAKQLDGRKASGETVGANEIEEVVLPELRELARRLSQDAKNRERKTNHARERESEGQRPTQLAFPEARTARDHHIHVDNVENTFVVVGKKGRIHVFARDGKHVTTVVMNPASVRQRVSQGRWRLAEPGERGEFRQAIAAHKADPQAAEPHPAEPQPEPPPAQAAEAAAGAADQS